MRKLLLPRTQSLFSSISQIVAETDRKLGGSTIYKTNKIVPFEVYLPEISILTGFDFGYISLSGDLIACSVTRITKNALYSTNKFLAVIILFPL